MNRAIYIALFFILAAVSYSSNSKFFGGGNPHDSLLFDGGATNYLRNESGNCSIKVISAIGKCIGTYYADSIGHICGEPDTIQVIRTGQLHKGYQLVPGTEVTTGPHDDVTNGTYNIVSLKNGDSPDGIMLGSEGSVGKVLIGKDCVYHVISGNISVIGQMDISTSRSKVTHKNTQYTLEVLEQDGKFTDVVKVYEGSVELNANREDADYKQDSKKRQDELKAETQKLLEDFQSGKLTVDEFKQRNEEIQKKVNSVTEMVKTVTINAGYTSSISEGESPTDPVTFDTNENRWWENK